MADDAPPAASGADLELASRRKDLEREYAEKQRDLKAQHKRHQDRLDADRADFEEYRRGKVKELADREQALKGREGRALTVSQKGTEDRAELVDLRAKVKDLQERRDAVALKHAGLEARAIRAEASSKERLWRLAAVAAVAVAGSLAWLLLALKQGGGGRVVPPLLALGLLVLATAWPGRRARKGP